MSSKKTTVDLTEENYKKMQDVLQRTQMSQKEFLNKAVAGVPIVYLGNQRTLAETFFELRCVCKRGDNEKIIGEVNRTCQLLNLLMEKIEELEHYKMA